tara:strand:- start:99 stop:281 length:183 start_codon:yes stop_codon:yes gene_type:complete
MDIDKQIDLVYESKIKLIELFTQYNIEARYGDDIEKAISALSFLEFDLVIKQRKELESKT